MARRTRSIFAALVALMVSVACSEPTAPERTASQPEAGQFLGFGSGSNLLECPTGTSQTTSGLISALNGGLLSVAGSSVLIPAGALLADANVTLTVPASRFMEVHLQVEGSEHFVFERPVIVTIGYGRCSRSNILRSSLTAWYIDADSKALLEHMGGIDNKLFRTVTFTTPHFSAYAVAE